MLSVKFTLEIAEKNPSLPAFLRSSSIGFSVFWWKVFGKKAWTYLYQNVSNLNQYNYDTIIGSDGASENRYSYQKHENVSSGYERPRETLTPLDWDTYLETKMATAINIIVTSREITLS